VDWRRLVIVGIERQGLWLSLSHIAEGEWRATFTGNPMFAPVGFGVATTPWGACKKLRGERSAGLSMTNLGPGELLTYAGRRFAGDCGFWRFS
jgi:hypothetical protein